MEVYTAAAEFVTWMLDHNLPSVVCAVTIVILLLVELRRPGG